MLTNLFSFSTVSSAELQPTAILVQEGSSVLLKIQTQLPQFHDLRWIKHPNDVVVSYNSISAGSKVYKDRVHFNKTTYSITLKNTWLNDSGIYEAKTSGRYTNITGLFNVTVGKC